MKQRIMLMLAFLLAMNISVFAQQGGGQGGQRRSVEERVKATIERLTTELSLNKDQQTKLDSVFTNSYKAMEKMRADAQASGNRPDREVFQKMSTERDEKVKAILTEDQFKKYKEAQEKMRQNGGNRGGGGNN
jgi:periplasmic protein CpxP/Spy